MYPNIPWDTKREGGMEVIGCTYGELYILDYKIVLQHCINVASNELQYCINVKYNIVTILHSFSLSTFIQCWLTILSQQYFNIVSTLHQHCNIIESTLSNIVYNIAPILKSNIVWALRKFSTSILTQCWLSILIYIDLQYWGNIGTILVCFLGRSIQWMHMRMSSFLP
jgi:hypothetical protein